MLDNYVKICKTGENTSEVIVESDPAGTQHQNDVVSTSMRRDHVASTLIRRHFNVVCLLEKAQISCASAHEGTDQHAHDQPAHPAQIAYQSIGYLRLQYTVG